MRMRVLAILASVSALTLLASPGVAQMTAIGAPGARVRPANYAYSVQGTAQAQSAPVSYASVTELNGLLTQLEQTSKSAQADLAGLRIEKWKTDGNSKKQALAGVDSVQRNLKGALPEIISQLRAAPEDVPATFKLYRNLDALYDVLGGVVESTGAFGSKDEFQAVSTDLNNFEASRRAIAGRIENLSASKEAEIVRLRTDLKTAQAAIPSEPPKKTVVDDTTPAAKKPAVKKKAAAKPATAATGGSGTAKPANTAKPATATATTGTATTTPATKPQ